MTSHQWKARIDQRQMERVADEIVYEYGAASHATGLLAEASELRRFQMMREQAAADNIETVVTKGKGERVGDQGTMATLQVGGNSVEIRNIELDPFSQQLLACFSGYFAISGSDFEQGEVFLARGLCDAFNQAAGGGDSAEPAVNAAEILEGSVDFLARAAIGVEDLRGIDALHRDRNQDSLDDGSVEVVNCGSKGLCGNSAIGSHGFAPGFADVKTLDSRRRLSLHKPAQTSASSSSSSCLL